MSINWTVFAEGQAGQWAGNPVIYDFSDLAEGWSTSEPIEDRISEISAIRK